MKKRFFILTAFLAVIFSLNVLAQEDYKNVEAAKLVNEGNDKIKSGDYNGAIQTYKKSIDLEKHYKTYYSLGVAYVKAGNKADAEEALKNCIQLNPKYSSGFYTLGKVYYAKGEYEEAVSNYEKAKALVSDKNTQGKIDKDISRAYTQLGKNSLSGGSPEKALPYLEKAVEYDKYDAAYLFMAQAYVDVAQYQKAIEAADNALNNRETISKNAPYYYKGLAFKKLGNNEKAVENFNLAKQDPQYKASSEYELSTM